MLLNIISEHVTECRILLMLLEDVISGHVPSVTGVRILLMLHMDVISEHVPSLLWRLGFY